MRMRVSPLAKRDMDSIFDFLSEQNITLAQAVLARIRASMASLAIFPNLGHGGAVAGTHEWVVKQLPYMIIYRHGNRRTDIEILRVYHGARDRQRNQYR